MIIIIIIIIKKPKLCVFKRNIKNGTMIYCYYYCKIIRHLILKIIYNHHTVISYSY